jgi:hypothetical protein
MNWLLIVCVASSGGTCFPETGVAAVLVTEQQCLAGQHLQQVTGRIRGWCISPDGKISTVRQ